MSSSKHGLATFVHEKLVDPFGLILRKSAIEWSLADIGSCKIINVFIPPTSQLTLTAIPVCQSPVFTQVILTAMQHTDWGYDGYTNSYG